MNRDQIRIIREMQQANERIIRAVTGNDKAFKGQAPVNERVTKPVTRLEPRRPQSSTASN